jgi:hypothetical protein
MIGIACVYEAFSTARHFPPQSVSPTPAESPKRRSRKRFKEDVMQWHKSVLKSVFGKAALAAAALGGFMFLGGVSSAQAAPAYVYSRPAVRYDNYRAHEAVVRHGYYSPAANYWRYERHEAYVHGWRDRFGCWHRY